MSDDTTPPTPPAGGTPPPTPPGYGAPPAGSSGYNAVEAIKYGWARFSKSPATMLVPMVIVILIVGAVQFVLQLILRSTLLDPSCDVSTSNGVIDVSCGPSFIVSLFASALIAAIAGLLGQILGAGLIKSALNFVDGHAVNLGDIAAYATKPKVITTALIISAASFVGTLLCYLPGLAVSVLTSFAMFYVVDKNMEPVEAIKASAQLVISKFGNLFLFFVLAVVTIIAGALACLVGLFVAFPVVVIAAAYTFRQLNDEPVAPAES